MYIRIQSMFTVNKHDLSANITEGSRHLGGNTQRMSKLSFSSPKFTENLRYGHRFDTTIQQFAEKKLTWKGIALSNVNYLNSLLNFLLTLDFYFQCSI